MVTVTGFLHFGEENKNMYFKHIKLAMGRVSQFVISSKLLCV